ncbi:PREDICTED: O-acyltransferase WSD1-like [Tarenaya hassleriana]|uniref:O-acyltransferase WSD1-like n=1 Tax=Tarenaya hassleriana TaxID=28532 RepID=UPI00053C2DD3|nr:PREDICTED: O-acyltransferase WSD1-like [Tarenaya hassleriana]
MRIETRREREEEEEEEEEQPLSPAARLFHSPEFNCYIISVIGCKTKIDTDVITQGLKETLIRHPRFSSKLVIDGDKRQNQRWVRTKVNVEDHVVVPDMVASRRMTENPDEFLENYVSNLTSTPLDVSRPLWELHVLDIKTSDAENVAVLKVHHSIGDGMSLMSLVLACTRKTSNPMEIPSLPVKNRSKSRLTGLRSQSRFWWLVLALWSSVLLVFNTFCDAFEFVATTLFLKDTETPIKGKRGGLMEEKPRRFVHRTMSFDDIKLIKNTMNMTVNDVLLGITLAGLSRYLNRKYGDTEEKQEAKERNQDNLPKRIRLRAAVLVNLRPDAGIQALADMMSKGSKCKWGNWIGYVVIPFSIATRDDPLEHLRRAKDTIDRKKHSLEAFLTFSVGKFILETFGVKAAADIIGRAVSNTTMSFSNMMGPVEEISFYGHPITYLAPSAYGHPHALTMHFQSYMNKMTMSLTVDSTVITDPHRLCDDLEESLRTIKSAVQERGLVR